MRKATIYEVAAHAGVSIATVSRFLNSPDKVAVKTRDKIKTAMKMLDFTPHADAVARARSSIRRIGVLTPYLTAPSFVQRLRGIHSALADTQYDLITYSVDTLEQLQNYLSVLPVTGRIDGLIIMSLPFSDTDVERFQQYHLPVVSIEYGHNKCSSIEIDNIYGGRLAAEYLVECGYSRLGFIGEGGQPAYSLHATEERLTGFRKGVLDLGASLSDQHTCFHPYGMEFSVKCAEAMLAHTDHPEAIFCASDFQAIGVLKAARKLGLSVPNDIAVVGFDDIDAADYMDITTIRQSLDHSGSLAAFKLLEHMKDGDVPSAKVHLNLEIIKRGTT